MKKILLASILFLSFQSNPAFALLRLGIEGGLSMAKIDVGPTSTTTYNNRTGLSAGALLEIGFGNWSVNGEALYIQKGAVSPGIIPTVDTTYKFDYFEIPVTLKYTFGTPIVKPFIFAGGYFGFRAKAESQVGTNTPTDLSTGYKSSDMGLTFGGGLEIAFTPATSIFANGRYDLGLTNILDSPTTTTTIKNKAVVLMVGLIFGI